MELLATVKRARKELDDDAAFRAITGATIRLKEAIHTRTMRAATGLASARVARLEAPPGAPSSMSALRILGAKDKRRGRRPSPPRQLPARCGGIALRVPEKQRPVLRAARPVLSAEPFPPVPAPPPAAPPAAPARAARRGRA